MIRELLNTMANYNEKTIKSMGMFLSKKIGIPSTSELNCIEWNQNTQFIATGGSMGTLKIVKLDAVKGSNSLSVNQALEGHSSTIVCAAWNEIYQKLTTSDSSGLIIVWGIHNDSWFEEMINNRNKSTVCGMGWNCDGTKIAIAYADGQVIVGTMEGNRIWNKDLPNTLSSCEWAPDGNTLLFGTTEGEVHVYDAIGNFVQKINMIALESVELETALSKDLKKEKIIDIKWWYPTLKSKVATNVKSEHEEAPATNAFSRTVTFEQTQLSEGVAQPYNDRPRLLIAYSHGVIQLMRSENDPYPLIVRFPHFNLTRCRWSPNGAFFAVTGFQTDMPKNEQAVIHIVSAFGKMISFLRVKDTSSLTAVAWDPSGLRIAVTTDSNVYFGNIRPQYKWGYIGRTVIYVYEKEEKNQFAIVFYETKLEEVFSKTVTRFEEIACHEDYCVIVNRQDDTNGKYFAQLCNSIGTALDFKYTDVEPHCVALNNVAAVIAGGENYFIWHFSLPKFNSVKKNNNFSAAGKDDVVYALENPPVAGDFGSKRRFGRGNDSICALCLADSYFLAACESGALFKISLSDGAVLQRYSIPQNVESMQINSTFSRIATLDNNNILQFFEIGDLQLNKLSNLERRDVWSYKWDSEKEDMIALNEKGKMIVLKGNDSEDPVNSSGYICSFRGLTVRTVLVDNFLMRPETPDKKFIHDIEIKSLRDVKYLLERMKIDEATAFIEKNPHPKLWSLLAEVALVKLDIPTAEHAYVKLNDYAGLSFCKKLQHVASNDMKKAEVYAHFSHFGKAEKIYVQSDRKDQAIIMYERVYDWKSVLKLLPPDDDYSVRMNAIKHVADYYYERQKWKQAAQNYEKCNIIDRRIDCLIRGGMFGELEELARALPDQHNLLEWIGNVFALRGMCEVAVDCYTRAGMVQKAMACCIELNYWERANHIARTHNLADVDPMLAHYAEQLTGGSNEKSIAAVQLYKRAGRLMDSAKIVFDIARDERNRDAPYTRLKKIHVMGALLVEQIHTQRKQDKQASSASQYLQDALMNEMNLLVEESKIMENAWRGAEAYHFYLLAHQHFYKGHPEEALRTVLILKDYEDIIPAGEVYSLIALAAANVQIFSLCSKAFMKLESLRDYSDDERNAIKDLALSIFSTHPPNDTQPSNIQCPSCNAQIRDYDPICPKCKTRFPLCIASGRVLQDTRFWICTTCKHRAYETEISRFSYCPLCHSTSSFK